MCSSKKEKYCPLRSPYMQLLESNVLDTRFVRFWSRKIDNNVDNASKMNSKDNKSEK
jgi:hypothetical protein